MSAEKSKKVAQPGLFSRLYFVLILLVFPAFALYEGLSYFAANNKKLEISQAAKDLFKIKNDLKLHASESEFWINKLTSIKANSPSPASFAESLSGFIAKYDVNMEFATYSSSGTLVADNFAATVTRKDLQVAGPLLVTSVSSSGSHKRYKALDKLRSLLGRNLFIPFMGKDRAYVLNGFLQTDFVEDKYRIWLVRDTDLMVLVRFPSAELKEHTGLKDFMTGMTVSNISFASFKDDKLVGNTDFSPTLARVAFYRLKETPGKEYQEIENCLFSKVQTGRNNGILLMMQLQKPMLRPGQQVLLIVLLLLVAGIMLMRSGFFPARIEDLSLLVQICILMSISAGIPLLILGSVAIGYFNNKQSGLVREKSQQMVEFVQQFDQGLQLEYARQARAVNHTISMLNDSLRNGFDREEIFRGILQYLGRNFSDAVILRDTGARDATTGKKAAVEAFAANQKSINMVEKNNENVSFDLIGKQLLSAVRSDPCEDIPVDKAYILEMYFQKPVPMIVHDLLKLAGNLSDFAWGNSQTALFLDTYKVLFSGNFDHLLLVSFQTSTIQSDYTANNILRLSRNPFGFEFFVAQGRHFHNENADLLNYPEINELFLRVSEYPPVEPEIVEFKNEKHIYLGLNGRRADRLKFCVLYPLSRIENEIEKEAKDLIYLSALAVAIVIFMVLILYLNLLLPVNRLHQAAYALQTRDSSFRLPESQGDEFAEMATIFNASIADFEELQIASIVQKRLFPNKSLNVEGFSIFGRCLPMADLGGDYFDYFKIDDDHFALLLGDVAGHGVGASLIMAMAKAGVICAHDVYKDPALLLMRLHQIVFAAKSRIQRKVMTFQYMLINSRTRQIVYSNAGGCSPALVDAKTSSVSEISHAGPVLGGFKKTTYSNLSLSIRGNQAVIFYTDGMVEARNEAGIELGYQGLFDLFARCFDSDAHVYYEKVQTAFRQWLGNSTVDDDMTLIVMVCQNPQTQ
ncbi:MAG: SpoIIE family protein phosphatase [Candidatus Riflebacteria bacterium]|nr:SpoIIE family protein phosphatase [Candidatus Riflebacteria bacterium]